MIRDRKLSRKGVSVVEYALLVAVIVGALIAMMSYTQRAMQGKYKTVVNDLGHQYNPGQDYTITNKAWGTQTTTVDVDSSETNTDEWTTTQAERYESEESDEQLE